MADKIKIALQPLNVTLEVAPGTPLQDVLHAYGVEFPCGGQGRCRGCRIEVTQGNLPPTQQEREILSDTDLAAGIRLACRNHAHTDITLRVAQWDAVILAEHAEFAMEPREGLGIAIDLGTTTIVAQLLDLSTGHVLGVRTASNPQASHGADLITRLLFADTSEGYAEITGLLHKRLFQLINEILEASGREKEVLDSIVVAGNSAMHHFMSGLPTGTLARAPFEPLDGDLQQRTAMELGWNLLGNPPVRILPCLGGLVGGDILAGLLATEMGDASELVGLVDLGTNGEIAFGTRERILCTSTAAGPAFEGAKIGMGMQARRGAISEVHVEAGRLLPHVLGGGRARGICGSGLVDAVAGGLDLGLVEPSGRLKDGAPRLELLPPVHLTQADIRELQLAKGAIAAGIHVLLSRFGAKAGDVTRVYLAGAFGNYIRIASARRIGLLHFPEERIQAAGNTSLMGAKIALFAPKGADLDYRALRAKISNVGLATDPSFQEVFIQETRFPEA